MTHPGPHDSHHGPDGDAGDGAGGQYPARPLGPGGVHVLGPVILLNLERGHVRHGQNDDESQEAGTDELPADPPVEAGLVAQHGEDVV